MKNVQVTDMHYAYIMCARRNAVALSRTLKAQLPGTTIVKVGGTDKLEMGYVVLKFLDLPDGFPALLDVNNDVVDFAVYTEETCCGKHQSEIPHNF